jgi:hypothetical protein
MLKCSPAGGGQLVDGQSADTRFHDFIANRAIVGVSPSDVVLEVTESRR